MKCFDYVNFDASEIQGLAPFNREQSIIDIAEHLCAYREFGNKLVHDRKRKIQERKEYEDASDKTQTLIYREATNNVDVLLSDPSAGDLIPKEYWTNFGELIGSSLNIWSHPHLNLAFYKQLEILSEHKRSKYLVAIPCTVRKPYSSLQRTYRYTRLGRETGLFDTVVFSVIPVFLHPFDASTRYPFANYSWLHDRTSKDLDNLKILQSCRYFAEAVRYLGYEKIIFVHGIGLDSRIKCLKENWGFGDNTIIDVLRIPLYKKMHEFVFSTRELPEPKKIWGGPAKTRVLEASSVLIFLRDFFGKAIEPYISLSGCTLPDGMYEYAGYTREVAEETLAPLRLPDHPESSARTEIW